MRDNRFIAKTLEVYLVQKLQLYYVKHQDHDINNYVLDQNTKINDYNIKILEWEKLTDPYWSFLGKPFPYTKSGEIPGLWES